MGDKKRKRQSVARFIAAANESLRTSASRFKVVRVLDDDELEEVDVTEIKTKAGKYQLHEWVEGSEMWDVLGECVQDGETPGVVSKDEVIMREATRLHDGWAIFNLTVQRSEEKWEARWEKAQKQLDELRAELTAKDEQIAQLILEQSEAGSEWVQVVEKGIEAFSFSHFMSEIKKRLNRLAPGLTKDQMMLVQALLNDPRFVATDKEHQQLQALEAQNAAAAE